MYTKSESPQIFETLARRYDLVNRILSLGQDGVWRRKLVAEVPAGAQNILDVATGTGKVAQEIKKQFPLARIFGVDPSAEMLKVAKTHLEGIADFRLGAAESLPFDSAQFDAVTISFGIRNVADLDKSLAEMKRVLAPKGSLLVLEFSKPAVPFFRIMHMLYLRTMVPLIGFLFTRNLAAYTYLSRTIESFPSGDAFVATLERAGFIDVSQKPLMFGAVTIYKAFV